MHFGPDDVVDGSSPAADGTNRSRNGEDPEALEALQGVPQGAETSGVSASSGGSLPDFLAFPVAGCADMASRTQRLDGNSADLPSNNLHTTAFGEPPQRHDTLSSQRLLSAF